MSVFKVQRPSMIAFYDCLYWFQSVCAEAQLIVVSELAFEEI